MKSLKIVHALNQNISAAKMVSADQDIGFLLTNNIGGFLWLNHKPCSRYQGWFFSPFYLRGKKMFKIIENIEIKYKAKMPEINESELTIAEIKNNFWQVERKYNRITEKFFLPQGLDSLVYEVETFSDNKDLAIELFLDIREAYQDVNWGREYKLYCENDVLIIEYSQTNLEMSPVFLAIKGNQTDFTEMKNWLPRNYDYDCERQGTTQEKWVFQACQIIFHTSGKIVFSVSTDKKKAIQQSQYIFNNLSFLQQKEKKRKLQLLQNFYFKLNQLDVEKKIACICAVDALSKMVVLPERDNKNENIEDNSVVNWGIFAGLPWFFQFWVRDEAMCLKSFYEIDKEQARTFLFKQLSLINDQGYIDGTSDGVGWIFHRVGDYLHRDIFSEQEKEVISRKIEETIAGLLKYYTQDDFALGLKQQTWMDSLDRDGVRLEIQALRLHLYHLAYLLTKKKKYLQLEKKLHKKIKENFYRTIDRNGKIKKILIDGWDKSGVIDMSLRCNIFLACYIYPNLLYNKEWKNFFKNSLSQLWLEWGGIASLDKENSAFHKLHSGEKPNSYHQGDSWFWVNNLAAIVLSQVDKRGFQAYINKILQASSYDILWQGIIGHHSELSSARDFKAQGCLSQAWSSAMFIELCLYITKHKAQPTTNN